jgi:hypothetical protein
MKYRYEILCVDTTCSFPFLSELPGGKAVCAVLRPAGPDRGGLGSSCLLFVPDLEPLLTV